MNEDLLMDNANSPDLDGKYLGTITTDFVQVSEVLKDASYAIRQRGISEYPIFPICKVEQPVGALLIGNREHRDDIADTHNRQWHFYVSMLDEFLQRGLVEEGMDQAFKDAYKDPDEFCCLFVIDPDFTSFVFVPFPED